MDEIVLFKVLADPLVKMTILPPKKRFRFRPQPRGQTQQPIGHDRVETMCSQVRGVWPMKPPTRIPHIKGHYRFQLGNGLGQGIEMTRVSRGKTEIRQLPAIVRVNRGRERYFSSFS